MVHRPRWRRAPIEGTIRGIRGADTPHGPHDGQPAAKVSYATPFQPCGIDLGPTNRQPDLAERIDALLPQTQCTQCGFDGCRPYAEAVAAGEADINRCPPGGDAGVQALADLLGREPIPIAPECGAPVEQPEVAFIDESTCIGCTRCIQACPVDAIVGASKQMHTVIAAECTGCGLCLPPCPVDCIDMVPAADRTPLRDKREHFRMRYEARNERIAAEQRERERRRAEKRARVAARDDRAARKREIEAAVARARARRQARTPEASG
jgi:electron transport complex protein RnfB